MKVSINIRQKDHSTTELVYEPLAMSIDHGSLELLLPFPMNSSEVNVLTELDCWQSSARASVTIDGEQVDCTSVSLNLLTEFGEYSDSYIMFS